MLPQLQGSQFRRRRQEASDEMLGSPAARLKRETGMNRCGALLLQVLVKISEPQALSVAPQHRGSAYAYPHENVTWGHRRGP